MVALQTLRAKKNPESYPGRQWFGENEAEGDALCSDQDEGEDGMAEGEDGKNKKRTNMRKLWRRKQIQHKGMAKGLLEEKLEQGRKGRDYH